MRYIARGEFDHYIAVAGNSVYPAYIIKGKNYNLMIDAGINLMGPAYISSLEQMFGDRNALHYIFATHSHYDHLGAIPYLKRMIPQAKIGASSRISQLMNKPSVIEKMNALSESNRELFKSIVGDADVYLEPFELDFQLKEGDTFDLGEVSCEVYAVPGHTRDSLAFFIKEIGALFAAEAYGAIEGKQGEIVQVEFLASYTDYLQSLEKMIALKPRLIGMAHGWVLTCQDATEYLERSYHETEKYRRLIEKYLDQSDGDVEQAIERMVKVEYDEKGTISQPRDAFIENLSAQVRHISKLLRS